MTKRIFRIGIVNKKDEVIYLSDIFFSNKEAAIKQAENLTSFKKEVKTKKYIDACVTIGKNYTWKNFEKIRSDSKGRHVGIISEILTIIE